MSQASKIVVKRTGSDSYKVAKLTNPKVHMLKDLDQTLTSKQLEQYVRERSGRDCTVEVLNDA